MEFVKILRNQALIPEDIEAMSTRKWKTSPYYDDYNRYVINIIFQMILMNSERFVQHLAIRFWMRTE